MLLCNSIGLPKQVIKLELSPGKVEEAILSVMDVDANLHHTRAAAMFERSPLHVFMFNSQGALLKANTSALDACQRHTPGGPSQANGVGCCSFPMPGGFGQRCHMYFMITCLW